MMKTKKALGILFLLLLTFIWGSVVGFYGGINVSIPSDINITVDTGDNYQNMVNQLENISENYMDNKTICNFNITEDLYRYIGESYRLATERQNVKVIDTFCKLPARVGTLHITDSRELYLLELNKPVELFDFTFEIIGANDLTETVVLDVQGSRENLKEGDCISNGEVKVCAETIFISTIPYLDAVGNFQIEKTNASIGGTI